MQMHTADLSPAGLRAALDRVDQTGWDGRDGTALLEQVRRAVVGPVVRRSGLRGVAADQAAATGWAAAWDALRRPAARRAANPGGLVWVAVRRAVLAEVVAHRSLAATVPLDEQPEPDLGGAPGLGPALTCLLDRLAELGWERQVVADAAALLADGASHRPTGGPATRWRWVALRLAVPEWQAHRLAEVLVGGRGWSGVLELIVEEGREVLDRPEVVAALRATVVKWMDGPGAQLGRPARRDTPERVA